MSPVERRCPILSVHINPPVYRVLLIGPPEEGKRLARAIYPICKERRQIPAFFRSRRITKKLLRDLYGQLCRTAVVTFGPESEEVYDAILRDHSWIKVLRILEPGAPPPEIIFSYKKQVYPYPDDEYLRVIVSWMGIHDPMPDYPPFEERMPGALTPEELGAAPESAGGEGL